MRRGLTVILQSGAVTSLDWWSQLKVLGEEVILQGVSDDGPVHVLAFAKLGSEAEAQELFTVVNERIRLGARLFDVRDWTTLLDSREPTVEEGG